VYVFSRVVVVGIFCWHAGMVHRGGSINSYWIACSIAIPPLAMVGPILYLLGGEWFFFSDCSIVMASCGEAILIWGRSILAGSHVVLFRRVWYIGPFWREGVSFYLGEFGPFWRVQSYNSLYVGIQ
jgi:hypothetical protein